MNELTPRSALTPLLVLGVSSLLGFLVVFVNIPWEWNMFMDDTLYNEWMPRIPDLGAALKQEIETYWRLGRFYPVKYVANLLKWRYLPNDPYVFRYFNFGLFLLTAWLGAGAALRAAGGAACARWQLWVFLAAGAILHKPLLEVISLNPLGETWVALFYCAGAYCLFSASCLSRALGARLFFLLVALSKEPAALVFFGSAAYYLILAFHEPASRRRWLLQAGLDLLFFSLFLALALHVMAQGSFTKGAYFTATPWAQYGKEFIYKIARYALWTSPFIAFFFLGRYHLRALAKEAGRPLAAAVFYGVFGVAYLVFMSTQGRVAYQEIPASVAFFGLFSFLFAWLLERAGEEPLRRHGFWLLALFAFSYFVSVSRWERFVRGIVEPRRAVENLLTLGGEMTIVVPEGEILGHLDLMVKRLNPRAKIYGLNGALLENPVHFRGDFYVIEFPYYMGELGPALARAETLAGGWSGVVDGRSYRVYRGKKVFR